MFENIFETTPTHINEIGVKWWLDKDLTNTAKSKKLRGVVAWVIEEPNGRRTRVLTKGTELIYENTTLDGITSRIELLALAKSKRKK